MRTDANIAGNEPLGSTDGVPAGLTIGKLIAAYQTERVSTYHKLRHHVRKNQATLLRRIDARHGSAGLATLRKRHLMEWHMDWSEGGKVAMGHSFVAMMRTLVGFGADVLDDDECLRLSAVLHRYKVPQAEPTLTFLTADQADAVRAVAHVNFGWHMIALGQAIQFELVLRQKDVIGEWVPESEPGDALFRHGGQKWMRGLIWQEIDDKLILRHKTSKKQKVLEVDLKLAPMVVEELQRLAGDEPLIDGDTVNRSLLPATGPVVYCETNGLPWSSNEYRRKWRLVANEAGVPKEVKNMHSRHGGITEADMAGADIEHTKHAATHSSSDQTRRYSRGSANEKIAGVQKLRAAHRKNTKAGG